MRAIVPILLLVSGCSEGLHESSPARETLPTAYSADSSRTEWTLQMDTPDRGIGAYTVVLQWNAEVAAIAEIVPARAPSFKGAPESSPASFGTGQTRVGGFQAFGSKSPGGPVNLFTVVFTRKGRGTLWAKAVVEKLYDDENRPASGRLIDPEFRAAFP